MTTFQFTRDEVNALVEILFHYINKFINGTPSPDIYKQAVSLHKKIKPKMVERSGWIVVYPDRSIAGVYDTEERAKKQRGLDYSGQVIQIDWEEEE